MEDDPTIGDLPFKKSGDFPENGIFKS